MEIYKYAKELGYHDQVVVTGIQNGKKVCIDSDAQLLEWSHLVPHSFERVIVIYLEHPTIISVDETAVAWREKGLIARNLTAEFEHEDKSEEQSGYEGMYEEDKDDEEVVEEAINVEDEGDEEVIYEEVENDKRAENENEDSEEHEEDPEFYDSAYEQSEDEQCLLENDDKTFDNYVDHNATDIDLQMNERSRMIWL
ncbi:unnamed protein product [Prunus armeniaca]